jgi:hypothetical protein
MISVISDWVLATVRAAGLVSVELILGLLHFLICCASRICCASLNCFASRIYFADLRLGANCRIQ